jgi:hypothetical protein
MTKPPHYFLVELLKFVLSRYTLFADIGLLTAICIQEKWTIDEGFME